MENSITCKIDELENKAWYLNGKLHRRNGPAIEWPNGSKMWFLNGRHHREDGPAIETPVVLIDKKRAGGIKEWYLNDKRHREDGPAVERADGTKEWWLNGKLIAKGRKPKNWNRLLKSLSPGNRK